MISRYNRAKKLVGERVEYLDWRSGPLRSRIATIHAFRQRGGKTMAICVLPSGQRVEINMMSLRFLPKEESNG